MNRSIKDTGRRSFLKATAAAGLGMFGFIPEGKAGIQNIAAPVKSEQKPVFRFLQVNDLHVQSYYSRYSPLTGGSILGPNWYGDANNRAIWLLEALEKETFFPKLDFLLCAGDMIVGISQQNIQVDLEWFDKHFYRHLPIPLYPVMGNHENAQDEGNLSSETSYRQLFGEDKSDYQFIHKGIHFIVFNNSGSGSNINKERALHRAEKLKQMLKDYPALPKILCCHIPLIPVRHEETLAKSFRFPSYKTIEPECLQVAEQYQDKVLAVLSGHLHLSGVVPHRSFYQIVASGLASYPHDMVLYSVYPDRMDVEFIQIPSDLLEPASNLHGMRRLGRDFTDEQHLDPLSYIMGNGPERKFSIPMK
ncbi:MAG: metallophosphoesterase family protein [Mangrovibacterium sp.]